MRRPLEPHQHGRSVAREAVALRENLRRRKQQVRARVPQGGDPQGGVPQGGEGGEQHPEPPRDVPPPEPRG